VFGKLLAEEREFVCSSLLFKEGNIENIKKIYSTG